VLSGSIMAYKKCGMPVFKTQEQVVRGKMLWLSEIGV